MRPHCGVPALAVITVGAGRGTPASLSHPTVTRVPLAEPAIRSRFQAEPGTSVTRAVRAAVDSRLPSFARMGRVSRIASCSRDERWWTAGRTRTEASRRRIRLLRTHTCGELRREHVGQEVTLCGWVDSYRDHGGALFIDLRDRYGKTQVVFAPEGGDGAWWNRHERLRSEDVVRVTRQGRPAARGNRQSEAGHRRDRAALQPQLEVLNKSKTPPFHAGPAGLARRGPAAEAPLSRPRRREPMQRTLVLRSRMIKIMRDYFEEHGFIDVETPMLGRSTPEGARDYLVPSRIAARLLLRACRSRRSFTSRS